MVKQPQQAQGMQQEIRELEERLSHLKRLQPSYDKLIQLRDTQLEISKTAVTELQGVKRRLAAETEKVRVFTLGQWKRDTSRSRAVKLMTRLQFSR